MPRSPRPARQEWRIAARARAAFRLGAGCAASAEEEARAVRGPTEADAPLCRFVDTLTVQRLSTRRFGFAFVEVSGGSTWAEAELVGAAGGPRLVVRTSGAGWHLDGAVDLGADDALHASGPLWLSDGVGVGAGGEVRVRAVRQGEALVGPPRFAFPEKDGYSFRRAPERWVSCGALGLSFRFRDPDSEERDRAQLGLPARPPARQLPKEVTVALSSAPGSAAFAVVSPREWALEVGLLEERGAASRIVITSWTGTVLVGWVASRALAPLDGAGEGGLGLVGGLAASQLRTVCVARERLALEALHAGRREPIGHVDAATRFVRRAAPPEIAAEGAISVAPLGGLYLPGDVTWLAHPRAALECAEEPPAGQ